MSQITDPSQFPKALLAGHRDPDYTYLLLDENDQIIKQLDTSMDGDIELSANTQLRAGGKVRVNVTQNPNIDWGRQRLRIEHIISTSNPDDPVWWPIGVFLFESPKIQHYENADIAEVELLSKLTLLSEDAIDETFSATTNDLITDKVVALIQSVGETNFYVEPSTRKFGVAFSREAGTSKLQVINDMLELINYWSLNVDGTGRLYALPYVEPAARGVVWEFDEEADAFHLPDFPWEQNTNGVPNKYIVGTAGTDEKAGLVAIATNTNPDSPFSYAARGNRWITASDMDLEFATVVEGLDIAQRRLTAASSPDSTFELTHAPIPAAPNDVIRFRTVRDDEDSITLFDTRAAFQKIKYTLSPTALCTSSFKGVVSV